MFRKRIIQYVCLSVAAAVCAGCVTIGRADNDAALDSAGDTYFVIGVQPEATAISFFRGSIDGDTFHQNLLLPASFRGTAEDGYVVSRTHAGETLAITYIGLERKQYPFLQVFVPCRDSKTLVFTAPRGKVIYLGDVSYFAGGRGLETSFSQNFAGAKAFMESHYPKLADQLEYQRPEFLRAVGQGNCVGE